jgi:hypothetical protein
MPFDLGPMELLLEIELAFAIAPTWWQDVTGETRAHDQQGCALRPSSAREHWPTLPH